MPRTARASVGGISYHVINRGNGRVTRIDNLNGADIVYTYDDAGRTTEIKHLNGLGAVKLKLTYTYTDHNLPATITEVVGTTTVAVTTFTYDNLRRLIAEDRTTTNTYDLEYEYDQSGNRTKKIDNDANLEWRYTYDIDDPSTYGSANNRLMLYKEYDMSSPGGTLVATTWYFYNDSGNVTRVVTNEEGTDDYTAHRMDYFANGQAVEYVMGETWTWDEDPAHCPDPYDVTYARQFRYDGARQRYMNRELDPDDNYSDVGTTWSDYDGDYVYGDFTVSGGNETEERSFELGIGTIEDPDGTPVKEYFHADLIGTTRHMSDVTGEKTAAVVYTAFGERVSGTNHRYGYAGEHGYQTHDDSPFLHVGHRYYDPATGRFLQRDPIGIAGGTNVYAYVYNAPTSIVDPSGLYPPPEAWDGILDHRHETRPDVQRAIDEMNMCAVVVSGAGVALIAAGEAAAAAVTSWVFRSLFKIYFTDDDPDFDPDDGPGTDLPPPIPFEPPKERKKAAKVPGP